MHGTAAPYLDVPEYPDRPGLDLADVLERLGDRLCKCVRRVADMDEREWAFAEPRLSDPVARLMAAIEEIENEAGA